MRILYLTLKKEWFDMIEAGIKTEEYREIKEYWEKRLKIGYWFDAVHFRNGYSKTARTMMFKCNGIFKGRGVMAWGAPDKEVFIIKLGNRIKP